GVFSNRNMNLAVLFSSIMVLLVVYLPFLNAPFNTVPLSWFNWVIMLPLIFLPSIVAEIMKAIAYKERLSEIKKVQSKA
ncbi:MAG TPA: cation-translocating P-type ATPase C-terminal domain-containing protein, partial [Anaerolineaceae bacterium]|nr:cation-translocating P-type ATPase C-terminal domain-containing protein [Anaerolineaceae bacterium]